MNANFFDYQQQRLNILKYWGIGSMAVGGAALLCPVTEVRQANLQSLTWGAVDVALVLLGQRGARKKAARLQRGALSERKLAKEIRSFRRILQFNTGLDVVYLAGGLWLLAAPANKPDQRGMGIGILVQAAFLLLYDSWLAHEVRQQWETEAPAQETA